MSIAKNIYIVLALFGADIATSNQRAFANKKEQFNQALAQLDQATFHCSLIAGRSQPYCDAQRIAQALKEAKEAYDNLPRYQKNKKIRHAYQEAVAGRLIEQVAWCSNARAVLQELQKHDDVFARIAQWHALKEAQRQSRAIAFSDLIEILYAEKAQQGYSNEVKKQLLNQVFWGLQITLHEHERNSDELNKHAAMVAKNEAGSAACMQIDIPEDKKMLLEYRMQNERLAKGLKQQEKNLKIMLQADPHLSEQAQRQALNLYFKTCLEQRQDQTVQAMKSVACQEAERIWRYTQEALAQHAVEQRAAQDKKEAIFGQMAAKTTPF